MNMHRIRMMLICSLLAISLISLAGCESLAKSNEMDKISEERPENGLLFPDFSGNITDIRITTVERNVEVNMNAEVYEKLTQRQIYYGYLSNGQWYDMPCENFDLVGVIDGVMTDGYESAGRSHIVRIGPYLLVAICVQGYHDVAETTAEVTDSLNSKVIEMTEYYTSSNEKFRNSENNYAYFKENVRDLSAEAYNYNISACFGKWYYIILDYDNIPKDYEMQLCVYAEGEKTNERVLTYEDIEYELTHVG